MRSWAFLSPLLRDFPLDIAERVAIFNHMVKYDSQSLNDTFAALADPTRRAILARLATGDASVTELAAPFDVSLPAISKHLHVLEKAGLIQRTKTGRVHRLRLVPQPLRAAAAWIVLYQQFWEGQLDVLADFLQHVNDDTDQQEPAP